MTTRSSPFPDAREAINQESAFRQTPDEKRELLLNLSAAPGKGSERQTLAQLSRAFGSAGAEAPHAHRIAIGISEEFAARLRVERDITAQSRGKMCRNRPPHSLWFGSAQVLMTFRYAGELD